MSDPNKLEVEISVGSTGEIQALTKAIDGLSVSFKSLDAINTGGILAEFRTLATSMKGLETSMNGLSSTLVSKMQGAMTDVKKAATKGGKDVTAALTEGMGDAAKAVGDALKGAENAAKTSGKKINKNLKDALTEEEVVKQVKVTVTSKAINLGNGLKAVPRQSGAEDLSAMRDTVKALQEQAGVNDLVAQSVKNITKNSVFANKSLEEQLKTARLVREISKVEGMTAKQLTDDFGTKAVWTSRNLVRVEEKIAAQDAIKLAESVAAAKKAEDISAYKSKLGVLNAQIKDASAKAAEEVAIVEASERAKAAAVARSNLIRVNQATQAAKGELSYPSGAYSLLDGSNVGTVKNAVSATNELTAAKGRLRKEMHELHSAARGLASGFGAMWLTWGSIVPLMAGAAVSNAAVQAVKLGADVGQSLATIQNLANVADADMKRLNTTLLETARNGPFGPVEVAKALETLALAGLDANQQIAAIKPALDFAVAGNMGVEKAAESLIAISSAFGYQVRDLSVVSDVVAKTAAVSMTTVESMTASFRVASVVAQQYGISIQDVSTSLALLAKVGITGSAAGTAVRQMYTELIGASEKARKVMKDALKFDAFEAGGKSLKPLVQIISELGTSLAKMDFKSQTRALIDMGNERGTKALAANLSALQSEFPKTAEGAKGYASALVQMAKDIADAPGFSAVAAIGMSGSALNQMKATSSAFQAALVEGFQAVEPALLRVTHLLQDMFKSETFTGGVKALLEGIASVVEKFIEFGGAILTAGKMFVVYKVGAVALTVVNALAASSFTSMALTSGLAAAGINSIKVAAYAAAPGLITLNAAAGALGVIAVLATAGYAAYQLFWNKQDETAQKLEESSRSNQASIEQTTRGLDAEIERLDRIIASEGDRAVEKKLEAQATRDAAVAKIRSEGDIQRANKETELSELAAGRAALDRWSFLPLVKARAAVLDVQIGMKQDEIKTVEDRTEELVKRQLSRFDELMQKSVQAAAIAETRRKPGNPQGSGVYDADKKTAKERLESVVAINSKELDLVKSRYTSEASVIKAAEDNKKTLLKSERDNLIISSGAFHAKELMATEAAERAQLGAITRSLELSETARDSEYAAALKGLTDWKKLNADMVGDPSYAKAEAKALQTYSTSVESVTQKFEEFQRTQGDAAAKIKDGALTRLQLQANDAAGEVNKLTKASKEFWGKEAENTAKATAKDNLDDLLRYASPEAQAYLTAAAAEHARLTEQVLKVEEQITLATKAHDDYVAVALLGGEASLAMAKGAEAEVEKLALLRAELDKLRVARGEGADTAGRRAVEKFTKDEEATLVKSVAGAVETALFEGGKAGSKSLRKIITDQLKKPISVFIQASVQTLMGAGMSALGMGTASAAGSAAGAGGSGLLSGAVSAATLAASTFGTSAAATASGIYAGTGALSSLGIGEALTVGFEALTSGTLAGFAGGAGAIVGALGPIAIAVAGLYAIAKATEGETRTGGQYGYSFNGATVADPYKGGVQTANGVGATFLQGPSGGDYAGSAVRTAIDATVTGTNKLLGQLGSKATLVGFQAGYETSDSNRGGALAGGTLSTGATFGQSGGGSNYAGTMYDPTKGFNLDAKGAFEAFGLELQQATLEALQAAGDIPATVKRIISDGAKGEPISKLNATETAAMLDAVGKVTNEVEALKVLASALPLQSLKSLSFDAAAGLIAASGGLDKLTTNLGSFYQNFFTAEERNANLLTTTQAAFSSIGVTMPAIGEDTDAWYRSLVQSQLALDQTIPANAKATAGVLALGGAVSELSAVTKVTKSLERELAVARGSMTQRQADLQDRLAEATNDSQRALIRLIDTQTSWNDLLSNVDSDITSETDTSAKDVAEAAKKANDDMASAGDGIRDFLKEISGGAKDSVASMSKLRAAYLQDLAGAQRGDLKSSEDIAGSGKAYLDAQVANSATLVDARRASAKMAAELRNLPATLTKKSDDSASAAGVKPEDPLKKLVTETMKDLKKFMKDLYEAEVSANTRGLLTDAAEALYESINAVKTADLSVDLKLTATTTLQDLAKTLSVAVTATYLDDATKGLVATAGTSLARAMTITVTSVHAEATRALGITALESTQRTLNLLISDKDMNPDLRKLALGTVNGFNGTVELAFSTPGMSAADIANAVNLVSVLNRTITIAVSSDTLTLEQKTMALMTAQTITKTVNFAITNLTGSDKQAVLAASETVTRTLNLIVTDDGMNPDLRRLALSTVNGFSGTLSLAITTPGMSSADIANAANIVSVLNRTITVAVSSETLTLEQKSLALMTANTVTKTVDFAIKNLTGTDKDALLAATGSIARYVEVSVRNSDPVGIMLATTASSALNTIVKATNGVFTPEVEKLLLDGDLNKIIALGATLTVPAEVAATKTDLLTGGNLVITPVLDTTAATAFTSTVTSLTTPVMQRVDIVTFHHTGENEGAGSTVGYTTTDTRYIPVKPNALGNAFGTLTAFAKGGLPTNSVLNSPFFFNMGVAGEAGPEAIMPLKRGADGVLGVRADVQYQPAAIEAPRNQGDDASNALLAQLLLSNEAMRAELSLLRQSGQRTERHTEASSKTLTNVTRGGDAMQISGSTTGAVLAL